MVLFHELSAVVGWVRRATVGTRLVILTIVSRHCEDSAAGRTRQCDVVVGASEGDVLGASVWFLVS